MTSPWLAVLLSGCVVSTAWAQRQAALDSTPPAALLPASPPIAIGPDRRRLWVVGGGHVLSGVLLYRQARLSWGASNGRFHVKDDWTGDGLVQTDEISHFFIGYTLTKTFGRVWGWTGLPPKRARTLAAVEAAAVLTLVEVPLDAFNPRQGFGVGDLAFDYIGIGVGLLALHHPGRWDVKFSAKRNPFTGQESLFARDSREADNYIFWATYRPWGGRQPISVGLGHSARRATDGQGVVRELYLGVGVTLPDLVRAVAPGAARYFELLGAYYFNVNLRATVK